jgi:hypothetical protein
LSKNLTEEEIDEGMENFRQERMAKAEEEARDVRALTYLNLFHAFFVL